MDFESLAWKFSVKIWIRIGSLMKLFLNGKDANFVWAFEIWREDLCDIISVAAKLIGSKI